MPVGGYKDLDLSKRLKTLSFLVIKFLELRTKVGNRKGGINYRWKRCGGRRRWIKTATRVFQALRIVVNDEN
ncbi:putative S-adenosyl-L-methionine-dependent methyltransferase, MraW, recognition domain superfamily [Helianthus anomalus]